MTNIRQLLAINLKQKRNALHLTQSKLAEKADISTQYIAMIEIGRKFPSLDILERMANVLEIDVLDFFSPLALPAGSLDSLKKNLLADLEKEIATSVKKAIRKAVANVIANYSNEENKCVDALSKSPKKS